MKFKIEGKHAILAAAKNLKRKNKTFYGKKSDFFNLGLKDFCSFVESYETFLLTSEDFVESSVSEILENPRILLIDKIYDPRNLGNIIRSAAILGFNVLIREGACEITTVVAKSASGALEKTKIAFLKNFAENIKKFKSLGFWVLGLDEKGTISLENVKFEKIILVIGSEGSGLSEITKKNCDEIILLKNNNLDGFSTFNASSASAISMYFLSKSL